MVQNAEYFTAMVYRVGKYGAEGEIKTLQQAKEYGLKLVKMTANAQAKRPAMIYACTERYLNNVLVGTIDFNGVWHDAND